MYEIALVAGHYYGTPGKRIPKELDPNETPEWVLNDRVCDKIEALLKGYTGYKLLRLDDTTGKKNITLEDRTDAANEWGAAEYYSVHHNANKGKPWNGGGIVVYVHPNASAASREMQRQLYDALIAKTGLRGDRSTPLAEANFHELRETKMPAVLGELGFMDSRVDAPIILTEEYADKCAEAYVEVMVKRGNLKKKPAASSASSSSGSGSKAGVTTIELRTLREGDMGEDVRCLQFFLRGWSEKTRQIIDAKGGADAIFGDATGDALEIYQSQTVDEDGKPLKPDRVCGPKCWGAIHGKTK